MGSNPHKPPKKVREMTFSSQTCKTLKLAYHLNYCIDSNQILHSDKDNAILFVGDPNTRKANPRCRIAAIWKNQKTAISQAAQ